MLSLVWFILLSFTTSVISQSDQHPSDHEYASQPKSIFILAGQSNMAGRGGVFNNTYTYWDGIVPPECQSDPLILRLNPELSWERAREPLHRGIDNPNFTIGVGPGMPFARSVLEQDSSLGVIGLVPCAVGGTNIREWRCGGELYNRTLTRARGALRVGGGAIRAILWYQGESDTYTSEEAKLYKKRLEKFFTDIRSDLGSPLLPIIQVAIVSGPGDYIDVIRKAQLEMDLPNVKCVDAKGLKLLPDKLHLTTSSQVELGRMMADAFLKITAPLPVQTSIAPKRLNNFFSGFQF